MAQLPYKPNSGLHSSPAQPPALYEWKSSSEFNNYNNDRRKLKKTKSRGLFSDPEFQRKKRVANYKALQVEGKVKLSLRLSIRWLKNRYTRMVYGWW